MAFKPGADYARWDLLITEVTGKPLDVEYDAAGVLLPQSVGRYSPRPAYADHLKRALGYSITGVTREHKLFTCYGEHGANGKNLLSDTVRFVLGDYAGKAKPELLMTTRRGENDANRASPALVALRNKRFVEMSEPRSGCTFDNASVKSLTGDKTLSARANYAVTEGSVAVYFKLWLLANLKPPVDHMEQAVVGRLVMMPFDRQWNRPGTVDHNPELPDADKHLESTLLDMAEGVLVWLVEGAVEYHQRGLDPCAEVVSTTKDYFNEQEPVSKWISENSTIGCAIGTVHAWCNGRRRNPHARIVVRRAKRTKTPLQGMGPDAPHRATGSAAAPTASRDSTGDSETPETEGL